MKAIVQSAYGQPEDVLSLQEIGTPKPKANEALVRVRAASVHADVWHVIAGRPAVMRLVAGLRRPRSRVPGTDMAGVVEAVGTGISEFAPGDEVFGECIKGYQWVNGGAYAEYAVVRPEWIVMKPSKVTFEQAASVPTSGLIALSGLYDQGGLEPGQNVLINGAGGGLGQLALQIAVAGGATVTAVDDTERQELLTSAGAHHVVDYTQQDFTQGDDRYDLILDIPGNHKYGDIARALTPHGTYVLIGHDGYGRTGGRVLGSIPKVMKLMVRAPFSPHLRLGFSSPDKKERLEKLRDMMEAGQLAPIVGRTFPLTGAPAALRCLMDGQTVGRIVLTV